MKQTPLKAIRSKCLDCCCGSAKEVRLCPAPDCPLYLFRYGHNPNRKGAGNPAPQIPTQRGISDHNTPAGGWDTLGPIDEKKPQTARHETEETRKEARP